MGQILFPTDLSNSATNAFIYALHIAHHLDMDIQTLHVYRKLDLEAVHMLHQMDDIYDTMDLERFGSFKGHIEELRDLAVENNMSHIKLSHSLIEGKTEETILSEARNEKVNYIVMGTMGANFLKEIFLGSIAGEVMEKAPCWVFSIPVNLEFDGRIDRIAVTTDFTSDEAAALRNVAEFAKRFDAKVYCIHVDTTHTSDIHNVMDKFQSQFSGMDNVEFQVLEGQYVESAVGDFVKDNQIDLVCMLTHKRGFFEELFNYSNAKKLSYHLKTAVGAIPVDTIKKGESS